MKRTSRFLALTLVILLMLPTMLFPSVAASGSYFVKWSAADPAENTGSYAPTYEKIQPSDIAGPFPITGRRDGSALLPHAVAYGPAFTSSNYDAVQSLMPKNLALGQIVPFILEIKVSGSTAPEDGKIVIEPYWLTKTTPGHDFGFDPNWGVIAAFVDYSDIGNKDPDNNASVFSASYSISKAGTKDEQIDGVIQIEGLDDGDNIIVEVWVVLKKSIDSKVTGNVQTGLTKAYTFGENSTINVGNQTVPLLQSGSFFAAEADLSITKSDSPDPVIHGQNVIYSITVTNLSSDTVSNGILVTDTLDPNVSFVSASHGGSHSGGVVTWELFPLEPGESEILTLTVEVEASAPTSNFPGTDPDNRGGVSIPAIGTFDINNKVEVSSSITVDKVAGNNIYYQPTNVVIQDNPSMTIDKITVYGDQEGDDLIIPAGASIKWRYTVANTGNIPLTNISVTDNKPGVNPVYVSGDLNDNDILETNEIWIFEASGTAVAGAYSNTGTADSSETSSVQDNSNYFGTQAGIDIDKITIDGERSGDGLNIAAGNSIKWRYTVTNTGNIPLTNVVVTDNKPGVTPAYVSGDTNADNKLDPSETWIYEASGIAVAGAYSNIGRAVSDEAGPATDASNYFGVTTGMILDKVTVYGNESGDGLEIPAGAAIKWRYTVTNAGNVPLSNINVSDDQPGVSPVYVSGDLNDNGLLDPDETWIFEASGIAVTGAYSNTGTADSEETGSVTDTSNYFGVNAIIAINKVTIDGQNSGDGLNILAGSPIKWRYTVTNNGNVPLSGITVTDNMGVVPVYVSGDLNENSILETNEIWIFEASGIAQLGAYSNIGTADSAQSGPATDASSYTGFQNTPPPPTPPSPPSPPPVILTGAINLIKYLDSNGNGGRDPGEVDLNGVLFELYDANKVKLTEGITQGNGNYLFNNLSFGIYYLREVSSDYRITTTNFSADGFSNPILINSTTTVNFIVGNERIVISSPPPIVTEDLEEEIIEEEIPLATPELPDTGEIPPYNAYAFGSLLILAGLYLKRKF